MRRNSARARALWMRSSCLLLALVAIASTPGLGQVGPPPPPAPPPERPLPPMVAPSENPVTAAKALLGKILFWEEQLSADNTVACGSCHLPGAGGSDPRSFAPESVHPGLDNLPGTADDIRGSKGVVKQDLYGKALDDGVFFPERQVTGRRSMSVIGAGHAPQAFWDGRARGTFIDPETGEVVIPSGAALEIQALAPILSTTEMSAEGRTWADVTAKLTTAVPLALATDLPASISSALEQNPTYPKLFEDAFGTPQITARRIAMALATYERTLLANQTPFDDFARGNRGALNADQLSGLNLVRRVCAPCHNGPHFSDHDFHNTGVRPGIEDVGRELVTGNVADRGKFKTPSLRDLATRAPYFHNGGAASLAEVIQFYNRGGDFRAGVAQQIRPLGLTPTQQRQIREFLEVGTRDPRVERALPPFDHPTLRPHFRRGDSNLDSSVDISDAMTALRALFLNGSPVPCADAADANDDGALDLSDAVTVIVHLFLGSAPLPYPSQLSTGPDLTADSLDCSGTFSP